MKNAESRMQKTAARSAQHAPGPNRKSQIANHKSSPPAWLMAVLLPLVTIALYWPATGFDFVNYDDPLYVTANPQIQAGLTWEGLAWAFGRVHGEGTYWHPLTWVSHMVDCQLYGLKPWGHHLTSVLLHAANAALVFLVFRRMTGAYWRCVLLAGVFALHPVQVDSVAWVTERKNLLSAFFWLLTTWAYVRYARGRMQNPAAPNPQPATRFTFHASHLYLLSLCFFALGLMCKPILVTLPFVLLLLDYWPLGRMQKAEGRMQSGEASGTHHAPRSTHHAPRFTFHVSLLVEKVPFFVLAAASSAITILAHRGLGMLDSASRLPWDLRLENALVSYGRYLAKAFWPCRLAVFYPLPAAWPHTKIPSPEPTETKGAKRSSNTPPSTQDRSLTTPTARPTLGPDSWKELPVVPQPGERVVEIYKRGLELGNNPYAFSKVGDCGSTPAWFLGDFDRGEEFYSLGEFEFLKSAILAYQGSFERTSLAARSGFTASSLLTTLWTDLEACQVTETPWNVNIASTNR